MNTVEMRKNLSGQFSAYVETLRTEYLKAEADMDTRGSPEKTNAWMISEVRRAMRDAREPACASGLEALAILEFLPKRLEGRLSNIAGGFPVTMNL